MTGWLWALAGIVAAGGAAYAFGPREPVVTDIRFDANQLDDGVDAWFARQEARFDNVGPNEEKRVIWAGAPETRAPWAVVYIHGFSASSEELRPLPDIVAEGLGANIVFTRLAGHGRDGPAMAEATAEAWMTDMAEALAVGHRIGERVLVMSCSTGGTLTALALSEEMGQRVDGAVFVSPNFKVRAMNTKVMTLPFARQWLRYVAGPERSWQPVSEDHARYWTARYPIEAVLPMGAVVEAALKLDYGAMKTPALFVFDPEDATVDHRRTRVVAEQWGAASEVHEVQTGPDDDPSHHVIAGRIVSPGMTDPMAARVLDWAKQL